MNIEKFIKSLFFFLWKSSLLVTYGSLSVEKLRDLLKPYLPMHSMENKAKKKYRYSTIQKKLRCFFTNYLYHYQNKIEILNYQIIQYNQFL